MNVNIKTLVVLIGVMGQSAYAAETPHPADTAEKHELGEILVYGKRHRAGMQYLDSEDIRRLPTRNGTINELLRTNGAVQFTATANQSMKSGEIAPEEVSFHGEPYYNNRILLDGLSNNDIINPGYSNGGFNSVEDDFELAPTTMYIAPGSPESFQVDSSLLKNLKVYDRNAPAQYGRFTGGVIDAEIVDPDPQKASGSIGLRTTRSAWTRFHVNEENLETFGEALAESDVQPHFVKHNYHLSVNQPIGAKSALLFAYNRTQSRIPEFHRYLNGGEWKNEKRLSETWLLKGLHRISDGHQIKATAMYSPHEGRYYRTNTKDGGYKSSGGGWRFALESNLKTENAHIDTTLAYTDTRNKISYDTGYDSYQWIGNAYDTDSSLTWCSQMGRNGCLRAYQGGFGALESSAKTWTLKQDYRLNPLHTGAVGHNLSFGWNAETTRAESARPQASRYMYAYYNTARNGWPANITNVSPNCTECIPGEQYQTHMTYFPGYHAKVRYNHYSLYFSDGLEWKRLRLNLGLNASYDSFLKNFDTAPRFSFDYDTTGSGAFRLNGGLNRYYGGGILAYALREGIPPNESRTRINDPARGEGAWQFDRYMNNSQNWQTSRLDTPYSDEANLGFVWRFGNQLLDARYVHRKSRDQFTPEDDENGSHIMTNKGRGNSNHYSFTFENIKPYRAGIWAFGYKAGARYHKYRTNYNGNYEDVLTTDMTQVTDSYNLLGGKRYASLAEMPPFNFNSPWSAFVEIRTDIPKWRFQWTHSLNFRSAYKNYNRYTVAQCRNSSQPEACGDWEGRVNDYRLRDYKQALTLDWRFLWDIPAGKNKLNLSLDILNVLNKKLSAAGSASKPGGTARSSVSDYETGRQYWFGASYRW